MFSSSSSLHHATGRKALFALLKYNWKCARLLDEVLHQSFGEGEQFDLDSSFFGVLADLLSDEHIPLPPDQIACLALSKLGHPGLDIRQRAYQLAISLVSEPTNKLTLATSLPGIGSASANVYRHAQKTIATTLASLFADKACSFLAECTTRLSQLEAPRRQATLNILSPWLKVIQLDENTSDLALSNLMYLAIRFSTDHLDDIRDLFMAFAESADSSNVTPFVKFLFDQGGQRKSPDFVIHSQRVMACLAQSPATEILFDEICNFVEPDAMAAVSEETETTSPSPSLANLDALLSAPSSRSQTFSTGQLALLFAGELLPHRMSDSETSRRLPTLLHVALIHCDHSSPAIRDSCQAVLFQVLRSWISDLDHISSPDPSVTWATAESKLSALAQTRDLFWKADDDGGPESAFLAPPLMTTLVMRILGILLPLQPRLRQLWGELALNWATSCPIRHLACRSFQAFRILTPRVSAGMMSGTLARLSSTMASPSGEIQSFNQEILRTFASIVQSIPASEIHNFPQIFWCATACLTTPYEDEFAEAIELLTHVLDKTNLSDPVVIEHLMSFKPPDWVGPAPYLQRLLLVGLRSSKTAMLTFDLIRRLTSSPNDELIDNPSDRLLHGFIAALPWMLHSTDLGEPNEELAGMALDLAAIAETEGNASFARLLTSFARVRFRSKDDFIRQASSLIRDYMPTHALGIMTLLLGFVLNTEDWMQEKSMQVLKIVLAFPEARGPLSKQGEELLLPLLKLVTTKHSAQALDVLDTTASASASLPMETDLNGLIESEEFMNTEIFGPISDSGWSVPNINEISAITRENLTAVFNTCAVETRAASAHFSVVQFADIKQFGPNPSFQSFNSASEMDLHSQSPLSDHGHGHGHAGTMENGNGAGMPDNNSLGDLASQLHSLNLFFEENDGDEEEIKEPVRVYGNHGQMPSETISERRIRAILARGRTPSISSPIKEHGTLSNGHGDFPSRQKRSRHAHLPSEASSIGGTSDNDVGVEKQFELGAVASASSLSLAESSHQNHTPPRAGPIASTSSLSLNDSSNHQSNTYTGRRHIPSHSIASTIASADESQFKLDESTPSRSVQVDGQGHGQGHGRGEGSGGGDSGGATSIGGPVSMRSLTSNWSLRQAREARDEEQ